MNPPRAAEALLLMVVRERDREAVPGDLAEEFSARGASARWYWGQVLRSAAPLARMSVADIGWGRFVLEALGTVIIGYGTLVALVIAATAVAELMLPRSLAAWRAWDLATGLPFAMAAGYLSAWITGRAELLRTLILAVFVTAAGLYHAFEMGQGQPLWFLLGLVAVMLAGLFAGVGLRALLITRK